MTTIRRYSGRKRGQRRLEVRAQVGVGGAVERRGLPVIDQRLGHGLPGRLLVDRDGVGAAPPQIVDRRVVRDAQNPVGELVGRVEGPQGAERLDERVLGEFLGDAGLADHPGDDVEDRRGVAVHQRAIRVLGPVQRPLDQFCVGRRHGGLSRRRTGARNVGGGASEDRRRAVDDQPGLGGGLHGLDRRVGGDLRQAEALRRSPRSPPSR